MKQRRAYIGINVLMKIDEKYHRNDNNCFKVLLTMLVSKRICDTSGKAIWAQAYVLSNLYGKLESRSKSVDW